MARVNGTLWRQVLYLQERLRESLFRSPSAGLLFMSAIFPSLAQRIYAEELMDDLSTDTDQLRRALNELRYVNIFLGGYRALRKRLTPYLAARSGTTISILDIGTGIADYPERMVRWGAATGAEVSVTGVDANPAAVTCARSYLDERLPRSLRSRARVIHADAADLSFPDDSFNVVTGSLFLHHFDDAGVVWMLREMARIASDGILVNDLHRHRLAYMGIRAIAGVMPVSAMFANDGPLSVRRAFRPDELRSMAVEAGLPDAVVGRHWAFRLTLSTV